jgi:cobyrinic acid a,c-diamide synthase
MSLGPQRQPRKLGLMIAAPSSGSGKTLFTLALLRALKNKGYDIGAAKAGPDYIDPAFHELACGSLSINLDPWAMKPERLQQLVLSGDNPALLVEAMMGLYDGAADGTGSAADLAETLNLPVLLVINAAKQSQSIAALVRGFRDHREKINLAGVILNQVGSSRHEAMLRNALGEIGVAVLGAIPRSECLVLPERHLGLVQAGEIANIQVFIEQAAELVGNSCELDAIYHLFGTTDLSIHGTTSSQVILPLGQRIAIAKDEAFSFIYPHLIHDWKRSGAELSFFSPLANEAPREDADAVYLPGGYPELHGDVLALATGFQSGMEKAATTGKSIYGECGGYMVLGEGMIDREGKRHKMLGLLGLETSFEKRKLHLGYRVAKGLIGPVQDMQFASHEFHYTTALKETGQSLFSVVDALGENKRDTGLCNGSVFGSYIHLIDRRVT